MIKLLLSLIVAWTITFTSFSQPSENVLMQKIDHLYTVFITDKLEETVRFYEQYFGVTKVFESTFFVLLQTSDQKFYIAFMDEKHPTAPPTPQRFNGHGSFLTLEVPDCKSLFEEIKKRGLHVNYSLKDEPWGQRRFGVIDPNNLWIDVVEQIEPQPGFWDQYIKE